ncbi:hypothetical protein PoB_006208200 [Plakobranchus ocellatus]|uniref:Uncharacterized protein n=1 Tax=Plakobranchus ocellatus TaxID=259542 RepID=A0AAV4CUI0_9GAST|nr:hypothetical protein PoB_006208200 [Plakobranchus ocellatus]
MEKKRIRKERENFFLEVGAFGIRQAGQKTIRSEPNKQGKNPLTFGCFRLFHHHQRLHLNNILKTSCFSDKPVPRTSKHHHLNSLRSQDEVFVTLISLDEVFVTLISRDEVFVTLISQDEVFVNLSLQPG